jgi:hypothetical protein
MHFPAPAAHALSGQVRLAMTAVLNGCMVAFSVLQYIEAITKALQRCLYLICLPVGNGSGTGHRSLARICPY